MDITNLPIVAYRPPDFVTIRKRYGCGMVARRARDFYEFLARWNGAAQSGFATAKAHQMTPVDWSAKATIQRRSDEGSDLFYEFKELAAGRLDDMVRHVVTLPADERARLVIDAERIGSINIHEIVAMSQRPDFPG